MSQYESGYYGSGGGGGGYLQGGSPFSQSGSPGGKRSEVSHSLRPLTVSQLNKASQAHNDAEWRVDDIEIGQVTIVGHVASVQKQATNHVYSIDDGTGQIEARRWIATSEEDESSGNGIQEHRYVRVTGGLKSFGKKRYININNIRVIKDAHEIYFHILEAITITLVVERGPPSNPNAGVGAQVKAEDGSGNISAYSAQSNSIAQRDEFSHLPALQRSILQFIIDQPPRDEGVHVGLIAKATGGNDAHKISAALDKLMDDGHVFTTIDDSHFNVSI